MTTRQSPPGAEPADLERPDGARLAYCRTAASGAGADLPGVIFLGGFVSDMTGTKATALEDHARARGQAFIRFDYQGHGRSSGAFTEGTIGRWAADAIAVLDRLSHGPQILVGSSMGGWIMLLVALARPRRIAGLVGIAAAPDFTEDLMWAGFPAEARARLLRDGVIEMPSDYGEAPYPITLKLIEEARDHLLLRASIELACPVRLIHGSADTDVPWQVSVRLAERLRSDDVELTLVKDGDHRLSAPRDLERLRAVLARLSAQLV